MLKQKKEVFGSIKIRLFENRSMCEVNVMVQIRILRRCASNWCKTGCVKDRFVEIEDLAEKKKEEDNSGSCCYSRAKIMLYLKGALS